MLWLTASIIYHIRLLNRSAKPHCYDIAKTPSQISIVKPSTDLQSQTHVSLPFPTTQNNIPRNLIRSQSKSETPWWKGQITSRRRWWSTDDHARAESAMFPDWSYATGDVHRMRSEHLNIGLPTLGKRSTLYSVNLTSRCRAQRSWFSAPYIHMPCTKILFIDTTFSTVIKHYQRIHTKTMH